MTFTLDSKHYVGYIRKAAALIHENGEYVTALDAITGDGDHWANMDLGFGKMIEAAAELENMPISDCFKKIGMLMMSGVGGSAGALYGTAYLAAAKFSAGKAEIDSAELCGCLDAMVNAMMSRGQSQPGFKTMIDALYPAVETYKKGLAEGMADKELLAAVKQAAEEGAESTKAMEAVRGRACYQADKGVGHLDPGAVTMAYQIASLCDYISENLLA